VTLTPADADKILADNFAPWVQALGLSVEAVGADHAVLRLPWSEQLAREGGALSGQAMMAAGGFGPMTTVQQSTSFQRAVTGADVLVTARVTKLGRRLAFLDIELTAEGAEHPAARATTVYAFPG
jgi:acyl-coenzyme A thioesterase PaaI-like protein